MDDKFILSIFLCYGIIIVISGFLPDWFFSGSSPEQFDEFGLSDESETGSLSYMNKMIRFLYLGWTIDGMPAIFGAFLSMINIIITIAASIWGYNKIRGI